MQITTTPTKPYDDQKPGTSGLRKKVRVVQQENYLENFVQSVFDSLPQSDLPGCTLLCSGDGRYYNDKAIQMIAEIAAANKVSRILCGRGGLISTPAASCVIRERENGVCYGGFILTASHNPGGPDEDFGIKYNTQDGSPALEVLTNAIYERTKVIKEVKRVVLPRIDLQKLGVQDLVPGTFRVEIIDPVEDWMRLMQKTFDFDSIRKLIQRSDFSIAYDALNGVAGPYAKGLFLDGLGASPTSLYHCDPKEDFGGCHPDPNLTYAPDLVKLMKIFDVQGVTNDTPVFGAAGDGDADRNMILGRGFFVTPSDSVAIIAAYATRCIPYFKDGLNGVSRSMPTSKALDNVAKKLNIPFFEVPTGWKFFGNLMNAGKLSICGEESFGTGSDHVREKDGLWAVLAWLQILAYRNKETAIGKLVDVETIVKEFWQEYGRNYYVRHDYEGVSSEAGAAVMKRLEAFTADVSSIPSKLSNAQNIKYVEGNKIISASSFTYEDPVDKSISANQGLRFEFQDGSRVVWRLSGTGSVGATVRMYLEKYTNEAALLDLNPHEALKEILAVALDLSDLHKITGRDKPTVIT